MITALPMWEIALAHGLMPGVDESTLGDPDYLTTRLRQILTSAEEYRNEHRGVRRDGAGYESAYLRVLLQNLTTELSLFGRAADELFATLERQHPDMRWSRASWGFVGNEDPETPTPGESAPLCARRLRLRAAKPACGRMIWRGSWEGLPVIMVGSTP